MAEETTLTDLRPLDPQEAVFKRTEGGYLSLTENGTEYQKVRLRRALPYYEPEKYVCVCDPNDDREIGMIEDLNVFPAEQQALLREELALLYYTPVIRSIRSAKSGMGFMNFDVDTDAGRRTFRMRDPSRNIRYLTPDRDRRVLLTDTEGNRYMIEDAAALDRKSRRKIDTYLL